jgi:hypothetical protein
VSSPESSTGPRNWVSGRTVIPVVCSTHVDEVIDVVIRGSTDGLITLGPHGWAGACSRCRPPCCSTFSVNGWGERDEDETLALLRCAKGWQAGSVLVV